MIGRRLKRVLLNQSGRGLSSRHRSPLCFTFKINLTMAIRSERLFTRPAVDLHSRYRAIVIAINQRSRVTEKPCGHQR